MRTPTKASFALNIELCALVGETLQPWTYRMKDIGDEEADARMREAIENGSLDPSTEALVLSYSTYNNGLNFLNFCTRWVQQSMPVVEVGHKLAAALITTSPRAETLEVFKSPWKAWMIHVPEGLIPIIGTSGELEHIFAIRIVITTLADGRERWGWSGTGPTTEVFEVGRSAEFIFRDHDEGIVDKLDQDAPMTLPDLPVDDRAAVLCRRLIRAMVLMLVDPDERKKAEQPLSRSPKSVKARAAKGKGPGKQPIWYSRFVLGTPVKVDTREAVRAYAMGERGSPTVRGLVRGHFKAVAVGAARAQRKTVWIEPYYRGGEDLPFVTRPHVAGPRDPRN